MTVPEKKQMNAGVELLLKRMETNPEEFYTDEPHWPLHHWRPAYFRQHDASAASRLSTYTETPRPGN